MNNSPILIADSFNERVEKMTSWKDHSPKYLKRGVTINPEDNVVAVRYRHDFETNEIFRREFYGHNIVTNDGDLYYAQKAAGETPDATHGFDTAEGRLVLRNAATAVAKTDVYLQLDVTTTGALDAAPTDYQALNATYPLTADVDSDNTGAGVDIVTWLYDWLTTELNATGIVGGGIVDANTNDPPGATDLLLNHFTVTSFDKTASDTLKVFVNHEMLGI